MLLARGDAAATHSAVSTRMSEMGVFTKEGQPWAA